MNIFDYHQILNFLFLPTHEVGFILCASKHRSIQFVDQPLCYLYTSTSQIRMLLRVCLSLILLRLLTFASPPPPPQNISTNSNESRRQERKVGGWYQCTNVTHQHQKLAIPELLQNNRLSEDMETAESAQRGAFLE